MAKDDFDRWMKHNRDYLEVPKTIEEYMHAAFGAGFVHGQDAADPKPIYVLIPVDGFRYNGTKVYLIFDENLKEVAEFSIKPIWDWNHLCQIAAKVIDMGEPKWHHTCDKKNICFFSTQAPSLGRLCKVTELT